MSKIIVYPISCSSDGDLHVTRLNVWGEWDKATWLPTTVEEAKKRTRKCQERNKCKDCDFQIHRIEINRTKKTLKQIKEGD